jgi:D-3-phosphoglycerate dehydrogenase
VAGTAVGPRSLPHLVNVWGQSFYMPFADHLAIFRYRDQPGMIGRVGTAFGEHGVNIVSAAVGAEAKAEEAVMALTTDGPVAQDVIDAIASGDGFFIGRAISL